MAKTKKQTKTKKPLPVALTRLVQDVVAAYFREQFKDDLSESLRENATDWVDDAFLNQHKDGGAAVELFECQDPMEGIRLDKLVTEWIDTHLSGPLEEESDHQYVNDIVTDFEAQAARLRAALDACKS